MSSVESFSEGASHLLSPTQAKQIYRNMLMSRRIDDLEIQLKRQNRIYFQISCAGHEATQTAAAMSLKPGQDWFFTYYRERAFCLGLGITPEEMFLQALGAGSDPSSGGRQMPTHWASQKLNLVSPSSTTGTQFLQAVGCAEASLKLSNPQSSDEENEVVYVSSGEGATSEGEFHEALHAACHQKLPVIFHIQDNGYAISVSVQEQTPGGSISKLVAAYPNLLIVEYDGCDPQASWEAWQEGVAYARARKGPVLLHGHAVRLYSHSMSDDQALYRNPQELADDETKDPIKLYRQVLEDHYELSEKTITALEDEIEVSLYEARDTALLAAAPDPKSASLYVYAPEADCMSAELNSKPHAEGSAKTMVQSIGQCLADEMARDERVVLFGADVAEAPRDYSFDAVRNVGGDCRVAGGLQKQFGSDRVFNTPPAEAGLMGRAMGMALRGLSPVVEFQFFGTMWPAFMQVRDELAVMRWRSNNLFSNGVVMRVPYGGYSEIGSIYHSQTGEVAFAHTPGIRVVMPSNAQDAVGLLRTAIRCDDPVLFLEHKSLYQAPFASFPYPGSDFTIPFGKAKCVRAGSHVTVITYGALVHRCLEAAEEAASQGIEAEVLDLRTISPYDWDAIVQSVSKSGRVMIAHEDARSWGTGAEIAARIGDELFEYLDAPVTRVASKDTCVGFNPVLQDAILPQSRDVLTAIQNLARY